MQKQSSFESSFFYFRSAVHTVYGEGNELVGQNMEDDAIKFQRGVPTIQQDMVHIMEDIKGLHMVKNVMEKYAGYIEEELRK